MAIQVVCVLDNVSVHAYTYQIVRCQNLKFLFFCTLSYSDAKYIIHIYIICLVIDIHYILKLLLVSTLSYSDPSGHRSV